MARTQTKPAGKVQLILELVAYGVLTFFVLPFAAFVANFHLFGTTSEQRAEGFFWYWVMPFAFAVALLVRVLVGKTLPKGVKLVLVALILVNVLWPIGLKAYTTPTPGQLQAQQEAATQAEQDARDRTRAMDEAKRQRALQNGCGEYVPFNAQDYSERIQYYWQKILEHKGPGSDLPGYVDATKRGAWTACANGNKTPDEMNAAYVSEVTRHIASLYKSYYGEASYVDREAYYKSEQAKHPDRQIY